GLKRAVDLGLVRVQRRGQAPQVFQRGRADMPIAQELVEYDAERGAIGPRLAGVEQLKRPTACTTSNFHEEGRSRPARSAISRATSAASQPLLPREPPARANACSGVSVVSSPKPSGMPVSRETRDRPSE